MRIITKLQAVGDDCGLALTFRRPLFGSPRWRISMSDVEELVQSFIGVWNETDPQRRREMVRSLWRQIASAMPFGRMGDEAATRRLEHRFVKRARVESAQCRRQELRVSAGDGNPNTEMGSIKLAAGLMARRDVGCMRVAAARHRLLTLDQERDRLPAVLVLGTLAAWEPRRWGASVNPQALESDFSSASTRKSTSAGEIVNGGRTLRMLLSRPVVPTSTPRCRRSLTIRAASWRAVNFVVG